MTPQLGKEMIMQRIKAWTQRCPHSVSDEFRKALYKVENNPQNESKLAKVSMSLLNSTLTVDPLFTANAYSERNVLVIATSIHALESVTAAPYIEPVPKAEKPIEISPANKGVNINSEKEPEVNPEDIKIDV